MTASRRKQINDQIISSKILYMSINTRKIYYHVERCTHFLNNIIIVLTFILALLWVAMHEQTLEAWIALLGIVSIILSKVPTILKLIGYEKYPLGKGVISKGGCWLGEDEEEHKIKLSKKIDKLKTKIDYIPTERVMAHIIDDHLVFRRRKGDSGHMLRVDYELIQKD